MLSQEPKQQEIVYSDYLRGVITGITDIASAENAYDKLFDQYLICMKSDSIHQDTKFYKL